MRTRDWRRFQLEKKYRRRIKKFCRRWYYFRTANGDKIQNPIWVDFIGNAYYFHFKNGSTIKDDSKYSSKYSPNKKKSYSRDKRNYKLSYGLREKDKFLIQKIIREYQNDGCSEDYT